MEAIKNLVDALYINKAALVGIAALSAGFAAIFIVHLYSRRFFEKNSLALDGPREITRKIRSLIKESSEKAKFPRLFPKKMGNMQRTLRWAGMYLGPFESVWFGAVLMLLILFVAFFAQKIISLFILIIILAFILSVVIRAKRKRSVCVQELPDALMSMCDSMRAGYSFPQAIELVARESRAPVSQIFGALNRANKYQIPMRDALELMNNDLDLPEWRMISESLIIRERVGGNIVPIMEEIAKMLRQKAVVEREVKTSTAQGRLSGMIIASMVPISVAALYFFNSDYISILFETNSGKTLFTVAVVLEIVGFWIIHKITQVEY